MRLSCEDRMGIGFSGSCLRERGRVGFQALLEEVIVAIAKPDVFSLDSLAA